MSEWEKPVATPMALHLVAGPRITIMPGLEAIPVSEVELAAIERQAREGYEAELKARGWWDEYEVETNTAVNYGEGVAEGIGTAENRVISFYRAGDGLAEIVAHIRGEHP